MARVNITVPDDVLARAREHQLNVSQLAAEALRLKLEEHDKIAAFERMMAELDAELGPPDPEKVEEARRWADGVYGEAGPKHPTT